MIDMHALRIPSASVCFVLASLATDIAVAEPIGRYECNVIGAATLCAVALALAWFGLAERNDRSTAAL